MRSKYLPHMRTLPPVRPKSTPRPPCLLLHESNGNIFSACCPIAPAISRRPQNFSASTDGRYSGSSRSTLLQISLLQVRQLVARDNWPHCQVALLLLLSSHADRAEVPHC